MAHHDKDIEYVGDSRVPAKRVPNIPRDYSEYPGKTEPFWPNFLLKEWMVAVVGLMGFLILTVSEEPPLEAKADPTNSSYIPLPDWYFLFLYQFLKYKYVSGDYTVLGTVVFPGLFFGALLLAPWLDRGKERRPSKRPVATALMLLAIVSIFYLSWAAIDEHEAQLEAAGGSGSPKAEVIVSDDPGAQVWASQASCQSCHGADMSGNPAAGIPALKDVGSRLSADEIKAVITDGRGAMPGGLFSGSDDDLQKLSDFLANQK
ncbi:c-type cytochrome [Microaerobacter geothermalis]|uniref:menaquinol-cytochrome c reductase cytochrome b/c subunit n=1 Tax=Microaerobacter geothermalis TaxID=674972 RepID=UPI001F40431F|nr:menaquinol-cytochrome c reductase cytochrome b/c subunit [Microaerobacter geothermalis]MCF6093361.1 c-type cytochrome [Microaerobacter geothermalis]